MHEKLLQFKTISYKQKDNFVDIILYILGQYHTINEIIAHRKTLQPLSLAQGFSKSAATQYNLTIDDNSIFCPHLCSVLKAFELLFATVNL